MKNNRFNGHLAIFVANIFFGLNNPISRSLMPEILHPFTLTFFRIAGGVVLFWIASLFVKNEKVSPKDLLLLFFASFFSITANQIPFIFGLSKTSPIDASIVVTMLPIVSMLLAALIIKEPITFKKTLGVVIGASGALLLIFSHSDANIGNGNLVGNLIILSAVLSFALYLTLFKSLISRYSPITLMKWMFLFAAITTYPVFHKELVATDFSIIEGPAFWSIMYVVFFATFIGYLLLPIGQKVLRPTTLSMYNYMQPIVASIATVAMGLDKFGIEKLISAALVFTGVYIVTRSKSRAELEAEKAGRAISKEEIHN